MPALRAWVVCRLHIVKHWGLHWQVLSWNSAHSELSCALTIREPAVGLQRATFLPAFGSVSCCNSSYPNRPLKIYQSHK